MKRRVPAPKPTFLQRVRSAWRALTGGTAWASGGPVFAGARLDRLTQDWARQPMSVDRELVGDLRRLRARGRELVRDTPYGRQFLRLLADNVVGSGILLQARIKNARGEFNRTANDELERAWRVWGRPRFASADGRLSWVGIKRLAIQTVAADGECFLRKVNRADSPFGFSLQFIDADLLDETLNQAAADGRPEVRMGVEVDGWGRPTAYYFWERHPDDTTLAGARPNQRARVPAGEIVHLYVPTRPGQVRGYPWFAPVMFGARMLEGYQEAEVTAARIGAAQMGMITRDAESFASPPNGDGTAPDDEPLRIEAEPGSLTELPPGYGIEMFKPEHPTTAYRDFVRGVLQGIAAGLGASYASLSADLEGTSYASGRTGLLQERDHWRALQLFLIEHLCEDVFRAWLDQALLAGIAGIPGGMKLDSRVRPEQYEQIEWQPRGWSWVDPKNDAEAAVLQLKHGLTSRHRILAEKGEDLEATFAELDKEKQLAEEYGIEITEAPALAEPAEAVETDGEEKPDAEDRAARLAEQFGAAMRAMPAPVINVTTPPVHVEINKEPARRSFRFKRDEHGEITGEGEIVTVPGESAA